MFIIGFFFNPAELFFCVLCNAFDNYYRIAQEQREAERRKREFQEIEKAMAVTKRKFKKETTEVMLGVRSNVFRLYHFYFCSD